MQNALFVMLNEAKHLNNMRFFGRYTSSE